MMVLDSQKSTWLIYVLVVNYALCYQLQRPIEPFLVDKLVTGGASESAIAFGKVSAFFSVAQGVGSLVMGFILDSFGVRVGLMVNFIACAMQYYLLSISNSLEMLFLSKVPGMLMGGFLCAQTAVATITKDGPDRVAALGRLTSAYTVGGVLGPYLGGVLGSSGDYYYGARLATYGSLGACALVFLLPSKPATTTLTKKKTEVQQQEKDDEGNEVAAISWFSQCIHILAVVGSLLSIKVTTGIGNNMARSVQPLILKNELSFGEAAMGSVMSAQYAFGGFANAFLLAPLTVILGGNIVTVVRKCVFIMGSVYALQGFLFSPYCPFSEQLGLLSKGSELGGCIFVGIALLLSTFQFALATGITAGTQALVSKKVLGTLMGLEHSIFAIAGMLGPLLGSYVFNALALQGLSFVVAFLFFVIFIFTTTLGVSNGSVRKVL